MSVIIRELVTKVSFNVDRKGLDNFKKSIVGFKKQFLLSAGAAAAFGAAVIKAVSFVTDKILDTDEVARYTGIATKELVALNKVAEHFRIPEERNLQALENIRKMLIETEEGFGKLQELSIRGNFEIRDLNTGKMLSTYQVFLNILEALSRQENETLRMMLAEGVLGDRRYADLAKITKDEFDELIEKNRLLGEQFDQNKEKALEFSRNMTTLKTNMWNLAMTVLPPVISKFNEIFGAFNRDVSNFFSPKKNRITQERNFSPGISGPIMRQIEMRNTINITVPAGTSESQQQFLEESAKQAFQANFNEEFLNLAANFPRTY